MAADEIKFLGQEAARKLIQNVKSSINEVKSEIASKETTWNDIKDKPSYLPVVETSIVEILPETQLIDDGDGSFMLTQLVEGIDDGNTYIVTYNGVEYTCVSERVTGPEFTLVAFGNIDAMVGTPSENGEPFVVVINPPELVGEEGVSLHLMSFDGATEVTLAIRHINDTYTKKLDNKCLDLDWLPVKRSVLALEETIATHRTRIGDYNILGAASGIVDVTFDGVTYYSIPVIYQSLGAVRVEYCAGNRKLWDSAAADTGEPFFIRSFLGPSSDETTFYAADEGEHTVSISYILSINKMPESYLPDSVATKSYTESFANNLNEAMDTRVTALESVTYVEIGAADIDAMFAANT